MDGALDHLKPLTEQEYSFVEQPSEDLFCPVTTGLLLQPHLTECCGKHLSQEAATRAQGAGLCPLCNTAGFSTMLNGYFLRQVNKLHVFCRYEDRGCGWQGELSDLDRHTRSCPMRNAPIMTELPVYVCSNVHIHSIIVY